MRTGVKEAKVEERNSQVTKKASENVAYSLDSLSSRGGYLAIAVSRFTHLIPRSSRETNNDNGK